MKVLLCNLPSRLAANSTTSTYPRCWAPSRWGTTSESGPTTEVSESVSERQSMKVDSYLQIYRSEGGREGTCNLRMTGAVSITSTYKGRTYLVKCFRPEGDLIIRQSWIDWSIDGYWLDHQIYHVPSAAISIFFLYFFFCETRCKMRYLLTFDNSTGLG